MSETVFTPRLRGQHSPILHCAWAGVCLFILAILPFLPALHGQFTWDDDVALTNNAGVHAVNGLRMIWNPFHRDMHFFPLTFTSYWIEHRLWGLDPVGYHIDNMLLHAGSAVVLWRILKRLGVKSAWLAAFIWAIHPVQAESVAWIAERKNTLSGLCYFLAAWAYLRFERVGDESPEGRRWTLYAFAFLLFVAGMLAKSVICTLPVALLLVLWWKRKRLTFRRVWPLLPMLIAAFFFSYITAVHEHGMTGVSDAQGLHFTWGERVIIAGKDVWFYLLKIVVPFPLMAIYPRWTYATHVWKNALPPAAVLALFIALFTQHRRIGFTPVLALSFFLVTISPMLGFFNFFTMHYTFVADHYQYLACAGIIVPLVELIWIKVQLLTGPETHRVLRGSVGALLCAAMASLTAFYASLFQTNVKLWSWNVARNPAAFTAQHNLAVAYFELGKMDVANHYLDVALAEQPEDDNIQRTVGKRFLMQGDCSAALAHFEKSAQLNAHYGMTYLLIGDAYSRLNRMPEALAAYEKSIAIDGSDAQYYVSYAAALQKTHQYKPAADAYVHAILLSPGNLIIRYDYANLLLDLHKLPEAIEQYQFILKYQQNNSSIWHNLAVAYYEAHLMDQAMAANQRAVALDAAQSAPSTQTSRPRQP